MRPAGRGSGASVTRIVGLDGRVADPCDAMVEAMALRESHSPGAAADIAFELGGGGSDGWGLVTHLNCYGARAAVEAAGESHVFDLIESRPDLLEGTAYRLVTEPVRPEEAGASRQLIWEDMQPRLAAVGLADFPPTQSRGHRTYALAGPDGEWEDCGLMSVDDALARASELFGEACAEVTVWAQEPVRAAVDGDAVLDDVLEDIWQTAGTDAFEYLFDRVTRDELSDLSKRLTACLGAWLADTGNSLDGLWCGVDPRTFRRSLGGEWVELDGEVTR